MQSRKPFKRQTTKLSLFVCWCAHTYMYKDWHVHVRSLHTHTHVQEACPQNVPSVVSQGGGKCIHTHMYRKPACKRAIRSFTRWGRGCLECSVPSTSSTRSKLRSLIKKISQGKQPSFPTQPYLGAVSSDLQLIALPTQIPHFIGGRRWFWFLGAQLCNQMTTPFSHTHFVLSG